jgi:hypothetical protein
MPFTMKHFSVGGALVLLSACVNQTTVQNDYVTHRDGCQRYAESNIARFMQSGEMEDIRARNAKLVTLFSDCMFERGWTVATPEREMAQDDLPELNDVPAGAAAAKAAPLDAGRRAPAQQFEVTPAAPTSAPAVSSQPTGR